MKISKLIKSVALLTILLLLQSCQGYSDGRMLKKFVSRFNAAEYASAASYVYPSDRMNVAFFAKEVITLAPNTFIEIEDYETVESGEERYIKASIKWENTTPALMAYFNSIGLPVDKDGRQTIALRVRDTNDGETIAFPWGIPNVLPENLWIASAEKKEGKKEETTIKLYADSSAKSEVLEQTTKSLIVGQENGTGWRPAYQVTKDGCLITSYISPNTSISLDRTAYFHLGIFDSLGVILALVILIVIVVPFLLLHGVIEAIFTSSMYGPIIVVGLILVLLYVVYQLLEQILFGLFIINLPY